MNIGFCYNCSLRTNPIERLSPSLLNRFVLMTEHLADHGAQLTLYSPKHIQAGNDSVLGYQFSQQEFKPVTVSVPAVNGNWTYETKRLLSQGMGYQNFLEWCSKQNIGIYVPISLSELLVDKYETYKLIRTHHQSLQPYCEPYRHSSEQLAFFLENSTTTYVKPKSGNKGDGIATLKNTAEGCTVNHYHNGKTERTQAKSADHVKNILRQHFGGKRGFVIQYGVEALGREEAVFDIRVIMLYDSKQWTYLHEGRLSAPGSDVSNVSQGGRSVPVDQLLYDVLGDETSRNLMANITNEAHGLAEFLNDLHPGDIMEIAFDFVIDTDLVPRLLEVNTKPGLVNIGFEKSIFNKAAEDEERFQQWVYPHTDSIARFLLSKAAEA